MLQLLEVLHWYDPELVTVWQQPQSLSYLWLPCDENHFSTGRTLPTPSPPRANWGGCYGQHVGSNTTNWGSTHRQLQDQTTQPATGMPALSFT